MRNLTVPPHYSVDQLNRLIAQQENFLRGPLVGISSKDDYTVLEIDDRASDKPQRNTMVTVGRVPPDAEIVGNARIVVQNVPCEATIYRPV